MGTFKRLSCAVLCLTIHCHGGMAAVSLSQNQQGQALVVPYYTVANDLNTLVTINNSQDHPKALKVHIKDGRQGANIHSFNVYLAAQDSWSFAMDDDPNGPLILSNDTSCTLNLDLGQPGQPGQPSQEEPGWDRLVGVIEIIEMGQVLTESNDFFGNLNETDNCQQLSDAWYAQGPNSFWQAEATAEMAPASGGVSADVSVIDVANGYAFKVPTLAFNDFFAAGTTYHRAPEDAEPNLDSGSHDSLLLHQGQAIHTSWPTGYEAISALLMKTQVTSENCLFSFLAAQTDWVLSFPTWPYHRMNATSTKPFILNDAGDAFQISYLYDQTYFLVDESGRVWDFNPEFPIDPPPPNPEFYFTAVVNTWQIYLDSNNLERPSISGEWRDNVNSFYAVSLASYPDFDIDLLYSSRMQLRFNDRNSIDNDRGSQPETSIQHTYFGLPVTGFSVLRFINAGAQPGLLATYAMAKPNHSIRQITTSQEANHE